MFLKQCQNPPVAVKAEGAVEAVVLVHAQVARARVRVLAVADNKRKLIIM